MFAGALLGVAAGRVGARFVIVGGGEGGAVFVADGRGVPTGPGVGRGLSACVALLDVMSAAGTGVSNV